jgi:TRAP transporter TAXI family solute receptor
MKKVLYAMMATTLSLVLVLSVGVNTPAAAGPIPKTLVMGANPPGSLFYVMAAGFKKVLDAHTSMKVEVFPQGSTIWLPMLLSGEVSCGIQVPDDALVAYKGEAIYEKPTGGKGFPLRTLMLGTPLEVALVVPGDSDIKKPQDIKGKRMPVDYGAFYSSTLTVRALLANYGLTPNDVKGLNVTTYVSGVRALMEGRADLAFGSIGSGIIEELKASKGARYLSIDTSPEAVARMQEVHPGYYPIPVKPGRAGVEEGLIAMGKDINLITVEGMPEELAYLITKTIWDFNSELGAAHPRLKLWTTDRFASTRAVIPYHAGSIRLYKEKGVWTKELEAHQNKLLKIK